MKIGIGASRRTIVGKKKDADKSGIGIRIIRIVRSLSIVGSKILSFLLSETALKAMVMIGMTDQIGSIRTMTVDLVDQLGGGLPFMIGWGAGSVCTIGLVIVSDIFPGTKENLRRWPMHEFPMSSYFAGMLIPIVWSQGKIVVLQQGSHSFLRGVQRS